MSEGGVSERRREGEREGGRGRVEERRVRDGEMK